MVCFWRAPQQAAIALAIGFLILVLSGNDYVAAALMKSLEQQHLPPEPMPQAAAIVVLGGAVVPQTTPRPWVEVTEEGDRILYGARLQQQGYAPYLILSGGRIGWLGETSQRGEAADMAEIAQTCGVPASQILLDSTSLNTYENAVNYSQLKQGAFSSPAVSKPTASLWGGLQHPQSTVTSALTNRFWCPQYYYTLRQLKLLKELSSPY
ncbi:YdcF family protein [Synechococcus sp. PCC 6717]|nr:YdcF family protein [Synechococcus sp. PCC 6717]